MNFPFGRNAPTDLRELADLLVKEGIEFRLRPHPGTTEGAKELIGYNPAGDEQILVGPLSIIRGMVSFGNYEAWDGKMADPVRTPTAEEMLEFVKDYLNEKKSP